MTKDKEIRKNIKELRDVPKKYKKSRRKHPDPICEKILKNHEDTYELTIEIINNILTKLYGKINELDKETARQSERNERLADKIKKLKNT